VWYTPYTYLIIVEALTGSYKLLFLGIGVGITSRTVFGLGEGGGTGGRSSKTGAGYRGRGSSSSSPLLDGSAGYETREVLLSITNVA